MTNGNLHSPTAIKPGIIKSSLFSGILLSFWDNILGPRVKMLWQGSDKLLITKEITNFVSSHTLNGELCRVRKEGSNDTKFYVLADRGYIFYSSVFLGMSESGQTVFSLSFIMAIGDMKRYLDLQHYLNRQIDILVAQYRVLQEKNLKESVTEFDFHLHFLIEAIESLIENRMPQDFICIKTTAFSGDDVVTSTKLDDQKFLMRAITSHLQSGGCSVVVGKDVELINIMVTTLAMFLSPTERACSRLACKDASFGFERDLFAQGLPFSLVNGVSIESRDVVLSSFPTTLINVDNKDVQQTSTMQDHLRKRLEYLRLDLEQMLKDEEEDPPIFPTKDLFHPAEDIAILVQHFVSELMVLPNLCSVREMYRDDFLKLLKQKATALFSYVEAKSLHGIDPLSHADIRQMKIDLSLNSEADFRIVLAETEKLHPGFVSFLFRESRYQAIHTTFV
eukprot:gene7923-8778_t